MKNILFLLIIILLVCNIYDIYIYIYIYIYKYIYIYIYIFIYIYIYIYSILSNYSIIEYYSSFLITPTLRINHALYFQNSPRNY